MSDSKHWNPTCPCPVGMRMEDFFWECVGLGPDEALQRVVSYLTTVSPGEITLAPLALVGNELGKRLPDAVGRRGVAREAAFRCRDRLHQ
jgi:hypothetical protein